MNFTTSYRYFALGLLTLVYVFNFIDRQIVVILLEPIKTDLGLTDTQAGLLHGFAFAVFYVTFGVPIARLADRGNRTNIICLALATWSAMTALCGMAQNFLQLLLARIGVAIGEAGGSPPAHSIISDMFPSNQRATALAIYNTGLSWGILLGFMAGGWLNHVFGWRYAFIAVAIPGILYAVFLKLLLKEPPRGMADKTAKVDDAVPLMEVFSLLWERRSFRHMALAVGLHGFVVYGVGTWLPSFLSRIHGLHTGEIANWLGPISGFAGAAGAFFGGVLCDRLGVRDQRWYIWLPAAAIALSVPLMLFTYLYPDHTVALIVYILPYALGAIFLGPMIAVTHGLVANRMRAVASSVLFLIINLIGLGLGPVLTGLLSDLYGSWLGDIGAGLRWALISVTGFNLWCVIHYYLAAKHIRGDLARAPL